MGGALVCYWPRMKRRSSLAISSTRIRSTVHRTVCPLRSLPGTSPTTIPACSNRARVRIAVVCVMCSPSATPLVVSGPCLTRCRAISLLMGVLKASMPVALPSVGLGCGRTYLGTFQSSQQFHEDMLLKCYLCIKCQGTLKEALSHQWHGFRTKG